MRITLFVTIFVSRIAAGARVIELTQPAFIMAKRHAAAHFVCEYKYAEDAKNLRIALVKQLGNQSIEICVSSFTTAYKPFSMNDIVQCQGRPGRNRVNLTLLGLKPTDAGLYFCKMERLYPPPYHQVMGRGTQLYVTDSKLCPDVHLYLWIAAAVASGLLVYSIFITFYVLKKAVRKRSHSVPGFYMKITPM